MNHLAIASLGLIAGIVIGAGATQGLQAQNSAPAFYISETVVTDQAGYAPIQAKLRELTKNAGKFLAQGGNTVAIDGEAPPRVTIVQFRNKSVALVLGIIQVGPSIVIVPLVVWSWFSMETTAALLFTVYMIPVSLLDNVLRPMLIGRGLQTPMLVVLIGVIGGTLSQGITGLFLGPIFLAVAWKLLVAWSTEMEPTQGIAS